MTIGRGAALVLALVVGLVLPGCGRRQTDRDELRAALRATERLPGRLVYTDGREGRSLGVQGIVEDDFRFKARVQVNGTDAYDEVVSDDALALRFLDVNQIGSLVDKDRSAAPDVDRSTEIAGADVLAVLQTRRWVLDPSGAPPLTGTSQQERDLGRDPVLDAVSALGYVERAMDEAAGVEQFDPDDLTPSYRRSEDPFPKPDQRSDVVRYDLVRPKLPPPGQTSGARQEVPATKHFRKLAVYVKGGRVVQVQERVEITGRFIDEFIRYSRAALRESRVPAPVRQRFEEAVRLPRERFGTFALAGLNEGLRATGADPVLVRSMTLELRDLGQPVVVDLPEADVVRGSLDLLIPSAAAVAAADQQRRGPARSGDAGAGGAGGAAGGAGPGAGGGVGGGAVPPPAG